MHAKIPTEIQLEAICQTDWSKTYELILPFVPSLRSWEQEESWDSFKSRIVVLFDFRPDDLIAYLKNHLSTCEALLLDSYNKRSTPNTFIQEWGEKEYRVGWVPRGEKNINQIRVFSNFAEATADYVLFSWGLPRLATDQATWDNRNHF